MKKLAIWLNEHAIVLGDSIKANVVHLWCILISFVIVTVFAILGWRGDAMYYLLMVLLLGGAVVPPIFVPCACQTRQVDTMVLVSDCHRQRTRNHLVNAVLLDF